MLFKKSLLITALVVTTGIISNFISASTVYAQNIEYLQKAYEIPSLEKYTKVPPEDVVIFEPFNKDKSWYDFQNLIYDVDYENSKHSMPYVFSKNIFNLIPFITFSSSGIQNGSRSGIGANHTHFTFFGLAFALKSKYTWRS